MSSEFANPDQVSAVADPGSELLIERERILRQNLARLEASIGPSEAQIVSWREASRACAWVRCEEGMICRKSDASTLGETMRMHRRAIAPLIEEVETRCRSSIILEGVDPPWALEKLIRVRAPIDKPNFRQRVLVLQDQWDELLDGLAYVDLGEELGDSRILWFVGPGASDRLLEWAFERIDDAPPVMVVQNPLVRTKATPDGGALMRLIDAKWEENASELVQRVRSRPVRSKGWWANRFEQACNGGEPLRVMIPTARHTTYLKYAAADLQDAFTRMGCVCKVQMEEDDSRVISKSIHLRNVCDFDPDLIVLINYHRVSLSEHIPKDIPFVCWIQDAMPHLFKPQAGASLGEMDFVVGMVKPEMIDRLGYPADRTRWMPMVASKSKFAGEPLDDGFDCEIAWVTHQSEHPSLFRARLIGNMKQKAPDAAPKFEALLDRVEQMVLGIRHQNLLGELYLLFNEAFFPDGFPEEAVGLRTNMVNDMLNPYAERIFRHQTAQWAANIARRRGWRFRLYGNGWEKHPQLGSFAGGPLEHGDDLRACYRRSVVQIHASVNQATHQRVSECLLAGGMPLCRAMRGAFSQVVQQIGREAELLRDDGLMSRGYSTPLYVEIASCRRAVELMEHLHRLELDDESSYGDGKMKWPSNADPSEQPAMYGDGNDAAAEMVMAHADLFFTTEAQLEALIEKAINDQAWRRERIVRGVERTPRALTTEGFVEQVLDMVRSGLASSD